MPSGRTFLEWARWDSNPGPTDSTIRRSPREAGSNERPRKGWQAGGNARSASRRGRPHPWATFWKRRGCRDATTRGWTLRKHGSSAGGSARRGASAVVTLRSFVGRRRDRRRHGAPARRALRNSRARARGAVRRDPGRRARAPRASCGTLAPAGRGTRADRRRPRAARPEERLRRARMAVSTGHPRGRAREQLAACRPAGRHRWHLGSAASVAAQSEHQWPPRRAPCDRGGHRRRRRRGAVRRPTRRIPHVGALSPPRRLGRDGNPWSAGGAQDRSRGAGALCTKTNVLRRRSRYLS
jgi:hypothetical protein